jgi:plastocyanin
VTLTDKGVPSTDATIDLRDGAVWFEPDGGGSAPRPRRAEMVTMKKQFTPQLVVVPVGSTVAFPNQDPILHNVFSVSGKNRFDLGLLGAGKGKSVVFRESGLVRVFCNVHHAMFANVLVVATPHYARIGKDGSFRIDGVPRSKGKLHFWHARSEPLQRALAVPAPNELRLELPITLARVPAHKNKLGKSYARGAYD